MAGVGEAVRSAKEMQTGVQEGMDSLTSGAAATKKSVTAFIDFFHHPDNLFALAVCLTAMLGIYILLRQENIIPSVRPQGGSILGGYLARRMALRLILFIVMAAIGLVMATGRLNGLLEAFKAFF